MFLHVGGKVSRKFLLLLWLLRWRLVNGLLEVVLLVLLFVLVHHILVLLSELREVVASVLHELLLVPVGGVGLHVLVFDVIEHWCGKSGETVLGLREFDFWFDVFELLHLEWFWLLHGLVLLPEVLLFLLQRLHILLPEVFVGGSHGGVEVLFDLGAAVVASGLLVH